MLKIKKYKLIDLFAGAGGLSIGFHWAGFETVFANEYDEEISSSYKQYFKNTPVSNEDIRTLNKNLAELESLYNLKPNEIDVIVGGPPCQGFSMANRKRIEKDERNLLFVEFVKFVNHFQPKCFLIENVLGMAGENVTVNSKDISVVNSMSDYFKEIGYQIGFRTFKAEEYGVPQFRRRVMIIGTKIENKKSDLLSGKIGRLKKSHFNRNEYMNSNVVSDEQMTMQFEDIKTKYKDPITVWDAISDLPILNAGEGHEVMEYLVEPNNDYQKLLRKKSHKVYNHISTPHSREALERIKLVKQGQNFQHLPKELQTKSTHSGAYGRLSSNEQSPTITTRFDTPSTGRVIHPIQDRTLTVREAARLQSFPDDYIFLGSRTSQGKQVGNAVPPLVAKAIAEMFINDFLK